MESNKRIESLSGEFTKIIPKEELDKLGLGWGNNGIGDRWRGGYFNYVGVYKNPKKNEKAAVCSENLDDRIPAGIIDEFLKTNTNKSPGIIGIFIFSIRNCKKHPHPIKPAILLICKTSCVLCGSSSNLVCDHKNDLYNDARVLNVHTQVESDFQPLCTHCNLQKRQICKIERRDLKLYSAKNIRRYQEYKFEFPWEKKAFDLADIHCKDDTYWFDPVEFDRKIFLYSSYVLPVLRALKLRTSSSSI